jgi:hypothetical protein
MRAPKSGVRHEPDPELRTRIETCWHNTRGAVHEGHARGAAL